MLLKAKVLIFHPSMALEKAGLFVKAHVAQRSCIVYELVTEVTVHGTVAEIASNFQNLKASQEFLLDFSLEFVTHVSANVIFSHSL